MARPLKQGLDYFPLDVNCDDKVKMIDARFGASGFGVLIKLWQIIYENGYFINWTEREVLLYKTRINADINLINDVINESVKWELFNKSIYESHSVLTSKGIQKRYLEAIRRRHEITVHLDYWIIEIPELTDKLNVIIVPKAVNDNNNSINADINPIDSSTGTQRKEKVKRKENIYSELAGQVLEYLNLKAETSYRLSSQIALKHIGARADEGFVLDDFKLVIDIKCKDWLHNQTYEKFLRPETLFGNKFEGYLNEGKKQSKPQSRYEDIGEKMRRDMEKRGEQLRLDSTSKTGTMD
jgi:uncharacterized phage protein (TIGR02220 family)